MTAIIVAQPRPLRRAAVSLVSAAVVMGGAVAGSTPAVAVSGPTGTIYGTVFGPLGGPPGAAAHAGRFGAAVPSGIGTVSPLPGVRISICSTETNFCPYIGTTDNGGQYLAMSVPVGNYAVRALPPTNSTSTPTTVMAHLNDGQLLQVNIILDPPTGTPPGTTVNATHVGPDGVATLFWNNNFLLTTQACPGGIVNYSVVLEDGTVAQSGAMTESTETPGSFFIENPTPLQPNHGAATVSITVSSCDPPSGDGTIHFDVYIDPSGVVQDGAAHPIEGATVTLYRSDAVGGPFTVVPNGSSIMSPSNRDNSDTTDSEGRFGWDVVAGYYKVTASKPGCFNPADPDDPDVESSVLTIPPAVTDMVLTLKCVSSLVSQPAGYDLAPGQARRVMVLALFTDATADDITDDANLSIDDATVAAMNNDNQIVAGETEGSTTLHASYHGVLGSAPVSSSHVASIVVRPNPVFLHSGGQTTRQLVAIAILDNGHYDPITTLATWRSSNAYRVTVTKKGLAKQKNAQVGDVTITASYDGKSGSMTVHNQQTTCLTTC